MGVRRHPSTFRLVEAIKPHTTYLDLDGQATGCSLIVATSLTINRNFLPRTYLLQPRSLDAWVKRPSRLPNSHTKTENGNSLRNTQITPRFARCASAQSCFSTSPAFNKTGLPPEALCTNGETLRIYKSSEPIMAECARATRNSVQIKIASSVYFFEYFAFCSERVCFRRTRNTTSAT